MTTDRTPHCTKIRYGITGAPPLDESEMDGSHAPGVGVSPTLIELVYSAARDGKPASVSASVTGEWTRFGKPDGGQVTTHFPGGPDGWPMWLAEEARLHDPVAAVPSAVPAPATDRAVVYREVADRLAADAERGEKEGFTRIYQRAAATKVREWADDEPLSPYYEHPECGFHWHGRDGMDIPIRDGEPVCPRCELARTKTAADLLRRTESYLSALHGPVARHDNLGVNLGCAGCELRDQVGAELRRTADEAQPAEAEDEETVLLRLTVDAVEEGRRELRSDNARLRAQLWTLAAALDGLHTLIATSSRDWQTYRVDAWIWAVLCGWDCEQAVHDETCTHSALEETAAMHGWDADTVAKARRYRAAVRAIEDRAAASQPGKEH